MQYQKKVLHVEHLSVSFIFFLLFHTLPLLTLLSHQSPSYSFSGSPLTHRLPPNDPTTANASIVRVDGPDLREAEEVCGRAEIRQRRGKGIGRGELLERHHFDNAHWLWRCSGPSSSYLKCPFHLISISSPKSTPQPIL